MDRQRANVGMNRPWNTWWSAPSCHNRVPVKTWKSSTPELDPAPSIGQESCSDSKRRSRFEDICNWIADMCTSIGDIFNSVNKCENGTPYISAIELEISPIQLKISPIQLEISTIKPIWRYLQFNCGYVWRAVFTFIHWIEDISNWSAHICNSIGDISNSIEDISKSIGDIYK